jgi:hypothetical protein
MLDRNPETRIKTEDILKDKWFEVVKSKPSADSSKKSSNKTPRSKENTKITLEHSPMMSTTAFHTEKDQQNIDNNTNRSNKFNDGSKIKKSYKASTVL